MSDEHYFHSDLPLLELLIDQAEHGGHPLNVTLHIGGALVMGYLISSAAFSRTYMRSLVKPEQHDVADRITEEAIGRGRREAAIDDVIGNTRTSTGDKTIYLDDAKTYLGGRLVPDNRAVWCGRLSRVDGFMLGSLHDERTRPEDLKAPPSKA